ncbi:MAG: mannose-1-phosphate guanylyltransferase [Chloroflexota bacterium]
MFALILAGGSGTRLWPRSRVALPKQLQNLSGNSSMMQTTVTRIAPIIPIDQTFIATNREYSPLMQAQLPALPVRNIIAEPSGKSTAPCIGLAAIQMQQMDPNAVMASLHSDHFIAKEEVFRQALLAAEALAKEGYLVTLGIKPTHPETGYGYVQSSGKIGDYNGFAAYDVAQFLEKPDLPTAQRFLDDGAYYWNSGIFIWQISTLMESYQRYLPKLHEQLEQLGQCVLANDPIDPIWEQITPESIDVGIMEQAEKVAVIPVDMGWNDVGSWAAIYDIHDADENKNVVLGSNYVGFNTTDTLIQGGERFIATIGLENVVIVDTDDALLVCDKDQVQDIKKVVNWLKENRTDLL